jgi:hypothetical protein
LHPNGIYSRLSAELKESEARTNARLDRLEAMLEAITKAAGLEIPPAVAEPTTPAAKPSDDHSPPDEAD